MPRGGRRSGKPGGQYSNRTDLQQAPRAAKGQEYGKAGEQLASQRAMPLGQMAPPPQVTPLSEPSERPDEPITSGLPIGLGPGPGVALGAALSPEDELRAIFQAYPNDDLAELVANLPRKQVNGPFARVAEPPGGIVSA